MSEGKERATGVLRPDEVGAVLETAHEAFVSIDDTGRIRAWNAEAERTFGWSRDEAVGCVLRDLLLPERFRAAHERGLRRFLATGEATVLGQRLELAALHRDGREFPVELTISALARDGRWTFNAFLRDISERRRATEVEARLAALVEASADAIVSRRSDGVITSWNPAAAKLYGYSAQEMIGSTLDRLVPPDRRGEARMLLERVLTGEPVEAFETQRLARDGRLVDVSITLSPIADGAGRITDVSLIARDISARKQAERALAQANDELRRLNELKDHFVAVASHELRTPLASISGFASTLTARWDEVADDDRRRFVATIDDQATRLKRLVDDILALSRIEAGTLSRPPERVEVGRAIRRVLAEYGADGAVRLASAGEAWAWVNGDDLHQIVLNYVANARTYGAPPVVVSVDCDEARVDVRVADTGPGLPPEFVPHAFDRFTQAPHATRRGSGLGLAIVKALAEAAGGTVWYEPNEPRGACFCLRLPSAAA